LTYIVGTLALLFKGKVAVHIIGSFFQGKSKSIILQFCSFKALMSQT